MAHESEDQHGDKWFYDKNKETENEDLRKKFDDASEIDLRSQEDKKHDDEKISQGFDSTGDLIFKGRIGEADTGDQGPEFYPEAEIIKDRS